MEYSPPLPEVVLDILNATSLCYLATSEDNAPHLSLMQYTWVPSDATSGAGDEDGVFVLSTRRATKKYAAIEKNPRVAILVHDFDGLRRGEDGSSACGGRASVTVYGSVRFPADPARVAALRALHLARNPAYPHFINHPDAAILEVVPDMARICDISDAVTLWNPARARGSSCASTTSSPVEVAAVAATAGGGGTPEAPPASAAAATAVTGGSGS